MGIYSGNLYRVLGVRIKLFFTFSTIWFPYSTCVRIARGENMLDIVLSSQKEFVDNVKICELLRCSDHNQIYCIIKVKEERNFTKEDIRSLGNI